MDLSNLQKQIGELVCRINTNHQHPTPQLISFMKIVEEIGEITKIVLSSEIKSRKGEKKTKEEIKEQISDELADTIISLISLGNDYDVDLNAAIMKKMAIHNNRN